MAWYQRPTLIRKINKKANYVFIDESGDIKDLYAISKKLFNNESVDYRNSNFVLTSVYMGFKNLEYIYASLQNFKKKHFINTNYNLHSTEIFRSLGKNSRNANFKNNLKTNIDDFIGELNTLMVSYKYKIVATALNKVAYINKYRNVDKSNSLSIILSIYKYEFIKIEKMLKEIGKNAIFVVEESSNPKIDNYVLQLFVCLRIKKILINSSKIYFAKKNAGFYPCGIEVADYSSRAIYSYYKNTEFYNVLRKVYNFGFYNENINFFDKKIKSNVLDYISKTIK